MDEFEEQQIATWRGRLQFFFSRESTVSLGMLFKLQFLNR